MRRRRLVRFVLIAVPVALIIYTLVGFFVVPWVVTGVVLPRVSEQLHGQVTVERARTNPFILSLAVDDLRVTDEAGDLVVGCDHVYVNAQISSLWRGGPHLKLVTLDRPLIDARLSEDGRFNLLQLVREQPDTEPTTDMRLSFERLEIVDGRFLFRDDMLDEPFESEITPINIVVTDFDTDPMNQNIHRFVADLAAGGRLAWEGEFFLDPLSSQGRFEITGLALSHYRPYLRQFTHLQVESGEASMILAYQFAPVREPRLAELTVESYELRDLALGHAGVPMLTVPRVRLDRARADAAGRDFSSGTLHVEGAHLRVRRAGDGTISLVEAVAIRGPAGTGGAGGVDQPSAGPSASAPSAQTAPGPPQPVSPIAQVVDATVELILSTLNPWDIHAERLRIEGATLEIEDLATGGEPVRLVIDEAIIEAGPIASEGGFDVPLQVSFRINGDGRVALKGSAAGLARQAAASVEVESLGLAAVGPYVAAAVPGVMLRDGRLDVKGDVKATAPADAEPDLRFTGGVRLADLRLDQNGGGDEPLLAFRDLALDGIDFNHGARTVGVGRLTLADPVASHRLEMVAIADPAPVDPDADVASAEVATTDPLQLPYRVTVRELEVENGRLVVEDATVSPMIRLVVSDLVARLANVDTAGDSIADVDVRGILQAAAGFTATGRLTPRLDGPFLDLTVGLQALPLIPFTAYATQLIGHPIERGRLTSDVALRLEQNQIESEATLQLDAFHLGDRDRESEAPNLPVRLALGLLRDRQDQIRISVPVRGDLSDPSVRVGHLVVQAIFNTVTRVAASPFDFIAGAFGGGDVPSDDLDRVAFAAGETRLSSSETRKLDVLAEALRERPALTLAIRGGAGDDDAQRLGRQVLEAELRAQAVAALGDEVPEDDPRRTGDWTLTPDEHAESVRALYLSLVDPASPEARALISDAQDGEAPAATVAPVRRIGGGRGGLSRVAQPTAAPRAEQPDTPPPDEPGEAEYDEDGEPIVTLAEMERALLASLTLPEGALAELAAERAATVRAYLSEAGGIEPARVVVIDADGSVAESLARLELQ